MKAKDTGVVVFKELTLVYPCKVTIEVGKDGRVVFTDWLNGEDGNYIHIDELKVWGINETGTGGQLKVIQSPP